MAGVLRVSNSSAVLKRTITLRPPMHLPIRFPAHGKRRSHPGNHDRRFFGHASQHPVIDSINEEGRNAGTCEKNEWPPMSGTLVMGTRNEVFTPVGIVL